MPTYGKIKIGVVGVGVYVRDLCVDIADSIGIEVGLGCGIGGEVEVDGGSLTGVFKSDFLHISRVAGEDFYIGTDVNAKLGVESVNCGFYSGSYEYTTYSGDVIRAKNYEPEFDTTVSCGFQVYALFGMTFEVSFDFVYFLHKRGINI